MKIFVRAKLKASKEHVREIGASRFEVFVKELPFDGKANKAIIRALADHFHVTVSQIRLVAGSSSRQKVFEIE